MKFIVENFKNYSNLQYLILDLSNNSLGYDENNL